MTLREAIEQFIAWRKSLGSGFVTQSNVLRHFLKQFDGEISCDDVTVEQVRSYLKGKGPLTQTRALKYTILNGFYRYAISRGFASRAPLPENEPKRPSAPPPYVYSRDELRRLFEAIDKRTRRAAQIDRSTVRTLFLLLYGTGLRVGEARRLRIVDVDLAEDVLTVHRSKFYKTRLVPFGPQLAEALREYANIRTVRPLPQRQESTFLANRDGTPLKKTSIQAAFTRVRVAAGIQGTDKSILTPCLHSFRHTFAVHRLTDWYREGANMQVLLPALSTYLGHARLSDTQVYLSMTPELLQEASMRFEGYVSAD